MSQLPKSAPMCVPTFTEYIEALASILQECEFNLVFSVYCLVWLSSLSKNQFQKIEM